MLIPKKQYEKITDMPEDEISNLFSKIPKIVNGILQATNADAFSLAQNNGRAAKQIIPHVHIHIIPRYNHKGTIWTKRVIENDEKTIALITVIKENIEKMKRKSLKHLLNSI